jgi:hypothetical protein
MLTRKTSTLLPSSPHALSQRQNPSTRDPERSKGETCHRRQLHPRAFKHKDFFEYKPQFKILLTSNHQIKGDVNDDAFWGRLRIIEFPHSFLGREDKTLKARMQSPNPASSLIPSWEREDKTLKARMQWSP